MEKIELLSRLHRDRILNDLENTYLLRGLEFDKKEIENLRKRILQENIIFTKNIIDQFEDYGADVDAVMLGDYELVEGSLYATHVKTKEKVKLSKIVFSVAFAVALRPDREIMFPSNKFRNEIALKHVVFQIRKKLQLGGSIKKTSGFSACYYSE